MIASSNGTKLMPNGHLLDGPLLLLGDEQDQQHPNQRTKVMKVSS